MLAFLCFVVFTPQYVLLLRVQNAGNGKFHGAYPRRRLLREGIPRELSGPNYLCRISAVHPFQLVKHNCLCHWLCSSSDGLRGNHSLSEEVQPLPDLAGVGIYFVISWLLVAHQACPGEMRTAPLHKSQHTVRRNRIRLQEKAARQLSRGAQTLGATLQPRVTETMCPRSDERVPLAGSH